MELKQDFWPNTLVRLLLQITPKRNDFIQIEKKRNIVAGMTCLCILHKLTLILQHVTIHTNHSAETVWFFFLVQNHKITSLPWSHVFNNLPFPWKPTFFVNIFSYSNIGKKRVTSLTKPHLSISAIVIFDQLLCFPLVFEVSAHNLFYFLLVVSFIDIKNTKMKELKLSNHTVTWVWKDIASYFGGMTRARNFSLQSGLRPVWTHESG